MREIVLDTETTGLSPARGDRIVEIGCVELLHHLPTGNTFHVYLNPERDMPEEAYNIHGLSSEFLSDKPLFRDIADEFEKFISNAALVIHNASFDLGFLNRELEAIDRPAIDTARVGKNLPAHQAALMPCANALILIIQTASNMEPCLIQNF